LNLDDTVAITQNFVNKDNFHNVWRTTRKERKKLSVRFLNKLYWWRPELYRQAIEMNE